MARAAHLRRCVILCGPECLPSDDLHQAGLQLRGVCGCASLEKGPLVVAVLANIAQDGVSGARSLPAASGVLVTGEVLAPWALADIDASNG